MKDEKEITIVPRKGLSLELRELWQYRELFYFFSLRDIKVKYKQTLLGFLWAVIQPLTLMALFVFFFAKQFNLPTDNIPAPLFYFSGLLLWNLFSQGISGSGNSMISNANIIKKIYFPRLIIPMSSVIVALFDFLMAFAIFALMIGYYYWQGTSFSITQFLFFFPAAFLLTLLTSFGLGTLLASLNVKYRDFRYVIPFLIQFLFFVTPVIYPVKFFDQAWVSKLLALNPMTGAIELARAPFVAGTIDWTLVGISCASAVLLFFAGLFNFKRTESYFADIA